MVYISSGKYYKSEVNIFILNVYSLLMLQNIKDFHFGENLGDIYDIILTKLIKYFAFKEITLFS